MNNNLKNRATEESSRTDSALPSAFPDGVYLGQEYIEDPERVEAHIIFKFEHAVVFSNIDFDHSKLHVKRIRSGEVLCTLEKTISKKLFNEISSPQNTQSLIKLTGFVLGYIGHYLPSINERILQQKYLDGHILARTISISDIYDVVVLNSSQDKGGRVAWPIPLGGFPPSKTSHGARRSLH